MSNLDELIMIAEDTDEDHEYKWPNTSDTYVILLEVEHSGPHYDDLFYNIIECPNEVHNALDGLGIEDLFDSDELPIASGIYKLAVKFWYTPWTDWETGYREDDNGFIVKKCERLCNLDLDLMFL